MPNWCCRYCRTGGETGSQPIEGSSAMKASREEACKTFRALAVRACPNAGAIKSATVGGFGPLTYAGLEKSSAPGMNQRPEAGVVYQFEFSSASRFL
jgi:hypothetical protein